MAKVQQKSEKVTPFGGIFFVLDNQPLLTGGHPLVSIFSEEKTKYKPLYFVMSNLFCIFVVTNLKHRHG
jgi:hypothetical protein